MKSYKEILLEVENIQYHSEKLPIYDHLHNEEHLKEYGAEHISTAKSGHKLYKYKYQGKTSYHAVNPDTKQVDIGIDSKEKNNVMNNVLIIANKGNTMKAHDFLHHVITHHDKTIVVDKMSPGGHSAFTKLQKIHGRHIGVHGWHKGSPVNVDMHDKDYTTGDAGNDPDEKEGRETHMVFHKK